ncbi:hypothetical protein B9T62_07155 [Paenibacillus donghaensis]|uniref:Lysine transporter LysE n=2 Tax=Paenibacillus donghaensis TaxID=414771 RepID=A0A2Z2K6R6_9BACL|nr:hypothetical protein B9T62_07155 [Paenibacillus donghaensis]
MSQTVMWSVLASGYGFGLLLAAPVGPMSLLCMNRTLRQGFRAGLATGLGIAAADAFYAFVSVSGLRLVSDFTAAYALPLQLLGSLFLGCLGVKGLLQGRDGEQEERRSWRNFNFLSALLLTLANPATVLTFLALAASLGHASGSSLLLPSGIALGSSSWWLLLTLTVNWLSRKVSPAFIHRMNVISALIFIGFSLVSLIGVINKLY